MSKLSLLFVSFYLLLVFACVEPSDCNNIANDKFQSYLNEMEDFLSSDDMKSSANIDSFITVIETITQIESESSITYFGKLAPSENDIMKWRKWYENLDQKLCWDEEKREFYLLK